MNYRYLSLAFWLLSASFQVAGQEQGANQDLQKQLTAQEQHEYRERLSQANGDAERKQITEQYENRVKERSRLDSEGKQQHMKANQPGGPGHDHPPVNRSGPSGAKNKPQKSGK